MNIKTLLKTLTGEQVQLLIHEYEPHLAVYDVMLGEPIINDAVCYVFNVISVLDKDEIIPGSIHIHVNGEVLHCGIFY